MLAVVIKASAEAQIKASATAEVGNYRMRCHIYFWQLSQRNKVTKNRDYSMTSHRFSGIGEEGFA